MKIQVQISWVGQSTTDNDSIILHSPWWRLLVLVPSYHLVFSARRKTTRGTEGINWMTKGQNQGTLKIWFFLSRYSLSLDNDHNATSPGAATVARGTIYLVLAHTPTSLEGGTDINIRYSDHTGWFFYWSALKTTKCQTLRKFWHLELFWRDLHVQ